MSENKIIHVATVAGSVEFEGYKVEDGSYVDATGAKLYFMKDKVVFIRVSDIPKPPCECDGDCDSEECKCDKDF